MSIIDGLSDRIDSLARALGKEVGQLHRRIDELETRLAEVDAQTAPLTAEGNTRTQATAPASTKPGGTGAKSAGTTGGTAAK